MPNQNDVIRYLVKRDKILKPVIDSCSYPRSRKNNDLYVALLSSIVSQQLSVKAADTIYQRFLMLFPQQYPDAEQVIKMRIPALQKAGLSRQKAGYIKQVAEFAVANKGLYASQFRRHSDQEVIAHLTQIKGVGQWTVEMLLMFAMDRKDVFSSGDLGIQKAMQNLYGLDSRGKTLRLDMESIAEKWRPQRSVVCKYFWQWNALQ